MRSSKVEARSDSTASWRRGGLPVGILSALFGRDGDLLGLDSASGFEAATLVPALLLGGRSSSSRFRRELAICAFCLHGLWTIADAAEKECSPLCGCACRLPVGPFMGQIDKNQQKNVSLAQVANLLLAAGPTHSWYKRKFEKYPPSRKAVIPFVY